MPFGRSQSAKAKPPLEAPALLEYALRSLASKMKSERDLRFRLAERAAKDEEGRAAIDAVVIKLKEYGYLSDERFAADFTRIRQENDKFGRRRVQQGLMQKGIPQDLANATLTAAYEDVDELALARQYVARKRLKKPEGDKEIARTMRRLLAAGFTSKTIWKLLRDWAGATLTELDIDDPDDDLPKF